jgi:hypothetical protein
MSILEIVKDKSRFGEPKEEKEDKKEGGFFDFLNQICNKTAKYPYNKKVAPAYSLSLWLAHEPDCIEYVNKINKLLFYIPDEMVYNYYFDVIPKGRRFIKYSKKKDEYIKEQEAIEEIMAEYNVSRQEANKIKKHLERLNV